MAHLDFKERSEDFKIGTSRQLKGKLKKGKNGKTEWTFAKSKYRPHMFMRPNGEIAAQMFDDNLCDATEVDIY